MKHYEPKSFTIPELKGISSKNIEEHLKLYQGYVKHTNVIIDKLQEYSQSSDIYPYEIGELYRRFSFEYNGMKNHEYYFEQISGGASPLDSATLLAQKINVSFGTFELFIESFKKLALTRGIGWAVLSYDNQTDQLMMHWIDEQHLGHLNSNQFIFGIDMWEHAYVADYHPSGKKQYIEDYINQVNWNIVAQRVEK